MVLHIHLFLKHKILWPGNISGYFKLKPGKLLENYPYGRAQFEMEFGLCSSMTWDPKGFGMNGMFSNHGFPTLEALAYRQICSSHGEALQEETEIGWDGGKTLGMCLGICFVPGAAGQSSLMMSAPGITQFLLGGGRGWF